MPNCDWGRPCDCSDCRELIDTHVCPSCGFSNRVSVIRSSRWVDDLKHGGGYYEFDAPTVPIRDLSCYDCGHCMEAVGYYTSVDEAGCQREKERVELIRAGKSCASCSKVEGLDWGLSSRLKLQEYGDRLLCEECLVDAAKQDKPDPSDKDNKYEFNRTQLEWSLVRVRIPCTICGKGHLVAVSERYWRTRCKKCYSHR
ncbi:hypothetical protein [Paenibacillus polymyxa]|uniref:hypothetical protein n=1 Tax=Paenibacillus polymyxa TaxID=1406 RepID=UPI0032AF9153